MQAAPIALQEVNWSCNCVLFLQFIFPLFIFYIHCRITDIHRLFYVKPRIQFFFCFYIHILIYFCLQLRDNDRPDESWLLPGLRRDGRNKVKHRVNGRAQEGVGASSVIIVNGRGP